MPAIMAVSTVGEGHCVTCVDTVHNIADPNHLNFKYFSLSTSPSASPLPTSSPSSLHIPPSPHPPPPYTGFVAMYIFYVAVVIVGRVLFQKWKKMRKKGRNIPGDIPSKLASEY